MTEIEKAQQTLASLEDKRKRLVERGIELADERQRVSFAAHTGDTQARAKLDEINAEHATHGSELASIEAAIAEAQSRLESARRDADLAADREAAKQLAQEWEVFVQHARRIDEALAAVVEHGHALETTLTKINALGAASPSRAQLDSLGGRAVLTALQKTPWSREFSPLPPRERTSFIALVEAWSASVANNVAARLGGDRRKAHPAGHQALYRHRRV